MPDRIQRNDTGSLCNFPFRLAGYKFVPGKFCIQITAQDHEQAVLFWILNADPLTYQQFKITGVGIHSENNFVCKCRIITFQIIQTDLVNQKSYTLVYCVAYLNGLPAKPMQGTEHVMFFIEIDSVQSNFLHLQIRLSIKTSSNCWRILDRLRKKDLVWSVLWPLPIR